MSNFRDGTSRKTLSPTHENYDKNWPDFEISNRLDFTKVNKRVQTKSSLTRKRNNKKQRLSFQEDERNLDNTIKDTSNVCILSEEVVGSVYAGRHMRHTPTDGSARLMKSPELPITIIMDIQWQPHWTLEIDAGAWRSKQPISLRNSQVYIRIKELSGWFGSLFSCALSCDEIIDGLQHNPYSLVPTMKIVYLTNFF